LVLKLFEKGNDDDYIDMPWKQNDVAGSVAQLFCGGNWGFAELEVHAPVIKDESYFCSHLKSRVFIIDISNSTGKVRQRNDNQLPNSCFCYYCG